MRRATTIGRISAGALASLLMAFALACDANGKSGTEAAGDDSSSVDLSWAVANPDAPGPGDQAPMLAIEETLSGSVDGDADWAALKGKATVLEFWATWCAPCVQVIPDIVARLLERPTVNETGITGRYQILLKFDAPEPAAIFQAIEDTLGLAVVEEKRPVEMLVVRKQAAGAAR